MKYNDYNMKYNDCTDTGLFVTIQQLKSVRKVEIKLIFIVHVVLNSIFILCHKFTGINYSIITRTYIVR